MGTEQKTDQKIKILAWGDYGCTTGFGTVMSNLMRELDATGRYDITVVGINYGGDPLDSNRWPGNVWPAMSGPLMGNPNYQDVYGRQRLLDLLSSGQFDILFMLQDLFVIDPIMDEIVKCQQAFKEGGKTLKTVCYFPVDSTPKPEWVESVVKRIDFPVTFTKYGQDEVSAFAADVPFIHHGTNVQDFYYVENRENVMEFRRKWFDGLADDRFLIVNVNRNQPRKDVYRSLEVLKELKRAGRNPLLYMHMQHHDVGGNLLSMAAQLGLKHGEDFVCPSPKVFNTSNGVSLESLNMIYNAADCLLTTTHGEGWGLSITEAMATKTPVVAPDCTSITEMLADSRGLLVPLSGYNVVLANDNDRLRPIMSEGAAARAIENVMDGVDMPEVDAAYDWVHERTWSGLVEREWVPIFDKASDMITNPQNYMNRQQRRAWEREQERIAKQRAAL